MASYWTDDGNLRDEKLLLQTASSSLQLGGAAAEDACETAVAVGGRGTRRSLSSLSWRRSMPICRRLQRQNGRTRDRR